MKVILLPIGPPGAGKSTMVNGLQQFMTAISRPCSVGNLDPANENIPYAADFDVRELVDVNEVMEREQLGPNGGLVWAMEELDANVDWLEECLSHCNETVILDPPGQAELYSHHGAIPNILHRLEKLGYRITILQLIDSIVLTRPSLYLSSLLLCLRGMLHLPYACVNIFTKIDNLASIGGANLPFNLDFYTEVQDLNYLLPQLSQEQANTTSSPESAAKWDKLNEALISLIESFGLVGFETCAIEDRQSMASLLRAIDRASGYVFNGSMGIDEEGKTVNDEASIWAQAMSDQWQGKMDIRDVQERWIDRKEEFDDLERKSWEEEAKEATARPSASVVRKAAGNAVGEGGDSVGVGEEEKGGEGGEGSSEDDDNDEGLLAEQRKWEEEQRKKGEPSATKVIRKT